MQEVHFSLPLRGNAGEDFSELHYHVCHDLLNTFGGYTRQPQEGAWRAPDGQDFHDQAWRYIVAVDGADEESDLLEVCIKKYCRAFGQQCVYVRQSSGNVTFVEG